jgi:hypothetical protein
LVQAAWTASHTKDSYFAAHDRRLATRRGPKRALVAVGHSLLVTIYHVLGRKVAYHDLGPGYFDRLEPERMKRYLVKRLQSSVLMSRCRRRFPALPCSQPGKTSIRRAQQTLLARRTGDFRSSGSGNGCKRTALRQFLPADVLARERVKQMECISARRCK